MFFYLVLLFVGLPLLELALLIQLGQRIGVLPTILLVVVTGILGAALARQQGLATLTRFQRSLEEGRLPHRELIEGILILLAGAVLLTPGLITDLGGFLLLVPPVRASVRRRLARWVERRFVAVPADRPPRPDGSFDVEYRVEPPDDREG